jgi:hypothetical protein
MLHQIFHSFAWRESNLEFFISQLPDLPKPFDFPHFIEILLQFFLIDLSFIDHYNAHVIHVQPLDNRGAFNLNVEKTKPNIGTTPELSRGNVVLEFFLNPLNKRK